MKKSIVIGVLIFGLLASYLVLVPSKPSFLAFIIGAAGAIGLIIHFFSSINSRKKKVGPAVFWIALFSLSLLFVFLPFIFGAALYLWGTFSLLTWVMVISLTISFYYNFLSVPLAIYHKRQEIKASKSLDYFPSLTILIPAHNEEKVLRRTIETVFEASYPDKEIIVIDDGSADRTYQIAQSYSADGVKVIQRPNGGKSVALNHGMRFARGEIVVIVDADSMVGKNTFLELVQPFKDPEVAAVAGNIKVLNRENWITRCQALEYIASINIYRRALDIFGSVTVVPGALGAYRREVLEGSGFYDSDTLVEDFDLTVKALKTGKVVKACNSAISYTEAPASVGELIKQRLRWNRGNFQALWKHRDVAFNSRFGFLQKLSFPYMVISMLFLPFAGLVTIFSTFMTIFLGDGLLVLPALLFFLTLQFLLVILALQLDNEDKRLVLYAPFFIIGYKQICEYILIKSLIDVLFRKKLKWTSVRRTGAEVSKSTLSG
jgi:cellulose synthase/poly-beta-1,6-N-acetylglucosamine synthase-like glycosyltransferase